MISFSDINNPGGDGQNHENKGHDFIWDEIEQLRKMFLDYVHGEDFDSLANDVDDITDKLDQIIKQGNFQIEENDDEAEGDDDQVDGEMLDNLSPANIKQLKKAVTTHIVTPNETEENSSQGAPLSDRRNRHKNKTDKPILSSTQYQQNDKSDALSPTKISAFSKPGVGRKARKGNSKTLQDLRKIAESWPKLEETIEELKSGLKLNYKNIFNVNETLNNFKQEINDSLKKRADGLFNNIQSNIKEVYQKIEDTLNSDDFRPAIDKLKVIGLTTEKLKLQFEAVHSNNKQLEQSVKDLQEFAQSPFSNLLGGDNGNMDEIVVNEFKEAIAELKRNSAKLKQDMFKAIKEIDSKLGSKVDEEIVNDLEEALHQGIDQVMTSSTKKFSDKRETNKAIRLLERNLKNMYDLFISKDEGMGDADDAMLAKKHFGFTCMSCEKNLINLEGKKADFNNWSKLPFRDPGERMLRVGQGFSKMLSQLKPDLSKVAENGAIRPRSGRNLSQDPTIENNHASSSLADFNKTDTSDPTKTVQISKSKASKIKVTKPLLGHGEVDLNTQTVQHIKTKKTQLPKIESAKNL